MSEHRRSLTEAGRLVEGAALAPLTTYKVGGPARYLVTAEAEADVIAAIALASEEGLEVFVLGRGSNVVISDAGFPGVVIQLGAGMAQRSIRPDGVVEAGAAAPLPVLARESARAGRGGLEFFTGIPGSVGGAVRMNAGCHGSETAEWLVAARLVSGARGGAVDLSPGELEMGYRHSNLTDSDVVVAARFRTKSVPSQVAEKRIREITSWRRSHQPGGTLNAGSAFKNPPGDAAGRIIDGLGLKGFAVGNAEVSRKHANFLIARGGASAADVRGLVVAVQQRVEAATGIRLEPEMRFVGEFA